MFHDGCFILEILRKFTNTGYGHYARNDPIFSKHGKYNMSEVVFENMLKIENQIPLLVLYKLVAVQTGMTLDESTKWVNDLMVRFIRSRSTFIFKVEDTDLGSNTCMHLLDLARKYLVGELGTYGVLDVNVIPAMVLDVNVIPAMLLKRDAKVKFNVSRKNNLTGFAFDKEKGILYLPSIYIYNCTESLLLNLMAFEHLHVGERHHVSSYVIHMGGLIQTVQDLNMIRHKDFINTDKDKN
ncbi:UPF0481 protein At3g47200-like [Tasmannia lanceolata]|uniref:UPF0481 protein At3g47200-like n=1 Tax=Tasmannia lanceolata TaxID=3420 RepID=UPI004062B0FE